MRKERILFTALTAVITAVLAIVLGIFASNLRLSAEAGAKLSLTVDTLEQETDRYETSVREAQNRINEIDEKISKSGEAKMTIEKYQGNIKSMEKEIAAAEEKKEKLRVGIDALDTELEKYGEISNSAIGYEQEFKAGDYECPKDIDAGRYKISGGGTVVLYGSDGQMKVSEILDKLDTGSFVLPIAEGEKIKLTKDVTLIEVK